MRLVRDSLARAMPPKPRTLQQFAEEEIRIPDGVYQGALYRVDRQPVMRHYFAAMESGQYTRVFATGPTQSGKTLTCSIIPVLYHLFEFGETTVFAVPSIDMAADKWHEDILPVIRWSRYAELLPTEGRGAKGSHVTSIRFKNGATLRFMTAGGGDKQRAGFTTRIVVLTEVDGFDAASDTSRETDKIGQIEARTLADPEHARVYGECTVSIEQGRTWQEYINGSESKVLMRCQHCGGYVLPEREHLVGWEEAETEVEAMEESVLCCPDCGACWTEDDRRQGVEESILIHKGQRIENGKVVGEPFKTRTLGFRWNAAHNLFVPIREYASRMWRATHRDAIDEELAERELSQFIWATPYRPSSIELAPMDAKEINRRRAKLPRSVVPSNVTHIAMGIDIGKWRLHWALLAWCGDRGHVVDYGEVSVGADHMDADIALLSALRETRDWIEAGFIKEGASTRIAPQQVWIDSGYNPNIIYQFCRESGRRYRPVKGHGTAKKPGQAGAYTSPKQLGQVVRHVGEEFHIHYLKADQVELVHVNADYWKSWLQRRFSTPLDSPGSISLWDSNEKNVHMDYAKSLCAEAAVQQFVPGKGTVEVWEVKTRNKSHWFDASYLACAALSMCGASLQPKTSGQQMRAAAALKRRAKPLVSTRRR